jgi:hypothetical protein
MSLLYNDIVISQFEAALAMLRDCLVQCKPGALGRENR